MFAERNEKKREEVEGLIEDEWKKYCEGKKGALGLGSGAKAERTLKQRLRENNSPQSITFGRIRQMNSSEQKLHKLLRKLGCVSYEQALDKVTRVNKAEVFLERVKQMMAQVMPGQEDSLSGSWRVIKEAVAEREIRKNGHAKGDF